MDTLHAYETLRGKFDEDTAKALVGAMAGLVTPSFADLATKADVKAQLDHTKAELRAEIQDVKARMEQLHLATKADTAELRAEIQGVKAELIRWLFGSVIALVSAMGIMLRLFR
jgi:hypothetical protein